MVSTGGNAYPDIVPIISSGQRSISISGRQFVPGTRKGYVGTDVVLNAGSFTNTTNSGRGSDNFSAMINSNSLACAYINFYDNTTSDSLWFARFNTVNNTFQNVNLVTGDPLNIATNIRQYVAANSNQNVAIAWWYPTAPTKLFMKESVNNGTSFGGVVNIVTSGYTVNGDQIAPWFGADLIYKPNSTTIAFAFNTLAPGNFGTAQGSKLLFWSPGINGGNPVNIADRTNMAILGDTAAFNNRTGLTQVGMTAVSHPSLAYSTGGTRLFCVFSALQADTSSYNYLYNDIYCSYSDNDGLTWAVPKQLTNTATTDEIYPTISRTANTNTSIYVTFSVSECPGSTSFTNTTTPRCKVWQVFRRYNPETGAELPIGITNISNEVPKSFSLFQNYPNPFNPSTKIRFSVSKSSNITIEVFDITGRLVTTLVNNEFVTHGTKEVDFQASNLSSGIYFYKLTAGEFTATRKMMLVK